MDTVLILKTEISQTSVSDVVELLQNKNETVAICNANTLVRSYKNIEIQNKINNFDIKAQTVFQQQCQKYYIKTGKKGRWPNVFHETIKSGLENNLTIIFWKQQMRCVIND